MFYNIEITGFRGIKSFKSDKLSQINLFFGKNNCCKSTLLEAIFLLSAPSNPTLIHRINNLRGFSSNKEEDLCLSFYNCNVKSPIILKGDSKEFQNRELNISTFHTEKTSVNLEDSSNISNNILDVHYGIKLKYKVAAKETTYSSELIFNTIENERVVANVDKRYKEKLITTYLSPKHNSSNSLEFIKDIIKNKEEDNILIALRSIEPRINNLTIIDNTLLVDIGLSTLLPINMMGDGIRKLLDIIINIYKCKDSILIIDEIDNGFHFSAMKQLWKTVIESAKLNNVQLFITTHNIDSLKGLKDVLLEESFLKIQKMVKAHKLIRDKDDIVESVTYSYDQLEYSINQELEVR